MKSIIQDTICAIASPQGKGAIAIIRISGNESLSTIKKIFFSKNNKKTIKQQQVLYGEIKYNNEIIDDVLITYFKAPYSYTGEDIVEISCHASKYIIKKIIEVLIEEGIRSANPGEFTLRAFLHGKLDLAQAEAIGDLIASETNMMHNVAIKQMRGGVSTEIKILRQKLIDFTSLIELELDFIEEDVEFADKTKLKELLIDINKKVEKLISSFKQGNAIKNGIPIAIVGEPNVGKSTLLNKLLNEEKAIVSEIPGTTRDRIEDVFEYKGINFRIIDTAGLRETKDIIESIGIKRTYETIEQASVVLYLFDASISNIADAKKNVNKLKNSVNDTDKHFIIVFNKMDKLDEKINDDEIISLSAKEEINIELLKEKIHTTLNLEFNQNDVIITNLRHYESLTRVKNSLNIVLDGLESGVSTDLLTIDIRQALHYLGDITGEIFTDDILDNIFNNFCVGK